MPHPEQEHSLRIQLATALRERDEAQALANQNAFVGARHKDRADAAEEALAAANARVDEERAMSQRYFDRLADAQTAEDVAKDALRESQEALAAARRECARLRSVLTEIRDHGGSNRGIWSQSQARAALASPAAAPAAEGECWSDVHWCAQHGQPLSECTAQGRAGAPATPPSEPVAPADQCRAEVSSRFPDYSHYECTLPKGHTGPHKEGGFAEWTDETHHDGAALADGGGT